MRSRAIEDTGATVTTESSVSTAARSQSPSRLSQVELLEEPAREVSEAELDTSLSASYGIFLGPPSRTAVLRFTPGRARWVAREQWHAGQRGHTDPDGSYVVEIPYSDDRELLLDILRYGSEVQVLEPRELRERVREELGRALQQYAG